MVKSEEGHDAKITNVRAVTHEEENLLKWFAYEIEAALNLKEEKLNWSSEIGLIFSG